MKWRLLLAMLFCGRSALCQATDYRSLGAYSNNFTNILSSQINVASLTSLQYLSAAVYAEKRFLLKEFANYQLAIGLHALNGGVGVAATYSGDVNFNTSLLQLAYAKSIGRIQIGFASGIHRINIAGYGSISKLNVQVATIWHVSTKLSAGLQLTNPQLLFSTKSPLNSLPVYRFGLGYESSENLLVAAEIYKESGEFVSIRVMVRYDLPGKFFLATGIMGATASPFFTAGLKWDKIKFEMSFGYHAQLGISPATAFIFEDSKTDGK